MKLNFVCSLRKIISEQDGNLVVETLISEIKLGNHSSKIEWLATMQYNHSDSLSLTYRVVSFATLRRYSIS